MSREPGVAVRLDLDMGTKLWDSLVFQATETQNRTLTILLRRAGSGTIAIPDSMYFI